MWQARPAAFAVAAVAGAILCASAAAEGLAVTSARFGENGDTTRFVLDLTGPAAFKPFLLPDPYRAVLDLPAVEWRLPAGTAATRGLVTAMRYGQFRPGTSRVVLDLSGPVALAKSFALPPRGEAGHRIVLDLKATTREAFLAALRAPGVAAPAPPPPAPAPPPRRIGAKRLVAIDPGHGGIDPGAIGVTGTQEKDVTLAVALALRRALLASGRYEVVLTREADTFLPLRDRFKAAQAAGAEIFVSLHADALSDGRVRGGSVYTLSETASDAEAAALAAKENKVDTLAGIDLSDHSAPVAQILIELTQRVTMNASAVLARDFVEELGRVTHLVHNTHRFAGFAVLKSPEIPSVLVEMGYLSNRADERRLNDSRFHARLAAAAVKALDRYFVNQQALKLP